jgi:hypothetical protein
MVILEAAHASHTSGGSASLFYAYKASRLSVVPWQITDCVLRSWLISLHLTETIVFCFFFIEKNLGKYCIFIVLFFLNQYNYLIDIDDDKI